MELGMFDFNNNTFLPDFDNVPKSKLFSYFIGKGAEFVDGTHL